MADIAEFSDLDYEERKYLAMHAIYGANGWLDPRYHENTPWPIRQQYARRWKAIADALDPEVWGSPNEVAGLEVVE